MMGKPCKSILGLLELYLLLYNSESTSLAFCFYWISGLDLQLLVNMYTVTNRYASLCVGTDC